MKTTDDPHYWATPEFVPWLVNQGACLCLPAEVLTVPIPLIDLRFINDRQFVWATIQTPYGSERPCFGVVGSIPGVVGGKLAEYIQNFQTPLMEAGNCAALANQLRNSSYSHDPDSRKAHRRQAHVAATDRGRSGIV